MGQNLKYFFEYIFDWSLKIILVGGAIVAFTKCVQYIAYSDNFRACIIGHAIKECREELK